MLAASLLFTASAQASVVSGSLTDPRGDGTTPNGVHPYDLESFSLRYDDAGSLTVSYGVHDDRESGTWFSFHAEARIGVWNRDRGACDTTSAGGASLELWVLDLPPEILPNVRYAVAGYENGDQQAVGVPGALTGENTWTFTFADAAAFAGRGYDCVTDVALSNDADGRDAAAGSFCMGPSGTATCGAAAEPIGIRWSSPRDGQTVSGVLFEGETSCLATATGPVVRTENLVDGVLHDRQVNAPWGCEIDTRELSDGPHTLTVRAFAADGRVVEDTIRVIVANRAGAGASPPAAAGGSAPSATTPPTAAGSDAPTSSGVGEVLAGGATGGEAAAGGDPSTANRRLTLTRAATLGRRALSRRFGRAFTDRAKAGYRMRCRAVAARRVTCTVTWRYQGRRYAGTVRIRRVGGRDATAIDVTRKRARGKPAAAV